MNLFSSRTKKIIAGFTLVEVVVASALITTMVLTLTAAAEKGVELSNLSLKESQASFLLEEGAEAVRSIRDQDYATISALSPNSTYYLSFDTGTNTWSLSTTPNVIDSTFTRSITVSDVYRDSNDDIAGSGTSDPKTRKVTVAITWNSSGRAISKTVSFYITDIFS